MNTHPFAEHLEDTKAHKPPSKCCVCEFCRRPQLKKSCGVTQLWAVMGNKEAWRKARSLRETRGIPTEDLNRLTGWHEALLAAMPHDVALP